MEYSIEFSDIKFISKFVRLCLLDLERLDSSCFHLVNEKFISFEEVRSAFAIAGVELELVDSSEWLRRQESRQGRIFDELSLQLSFGAHPKLKRDNVFQVIEEYPIISVEFFAQILNILFEDELLTR